MDAEAELKFFTALSDTAPHGAVLVPEGIHVEAVTLMRRYGEWLRAQPPVPPTRSCYNCACYSRCRVRHQADEAIRAAIQLYPRALEDFTPCRDLPSQVFAAFAKHCADFTPYAEKDAEHA